MDVGQLGLAAASVIAAAFLAIVINLATSATFSRTFLVLLAVALVPNIVVQYVTNTEHHTPSAAPPGNSPAGTTPSTPLQLSRAPQTHHHKLKHHPKRTTTSHPTAQGSPDSTHRGFQSVPRGSSAIAQRAPPPSAPGQQTVPPPQILDYTRLASVPAGDSSPNTCATIYLPRSDKGLLYFTAEYGSFSTPSFNVAGKAKRCATYTAPDAPGVNSDKITIKLIDRNTEKSVSRSQNVPNPS